jgi:autotransporter-associated beta strand protein
MKRRQKARRIFGRSISLAIPAVTVMTTPVWAGTNGAWNVNASGTYSNTSNWLGGTVADGIDAVADFSELNITSNLVVNVDASHNLGSILFADTTPSNSWIFNSSNSAAITLATSTGTPTVSVSGLGVGNSYGAFLNMPILGTQGFTKTGNGDLILSGGASNVISGNINVNAGFLGTSTSADFKNISGSVIVASGAVFDANGGFGSSNFTNTFNLSGSGNSNSVPASSIVSGYSSGSGSYGALNVRGNATISGNIVLNANSTISHDYNNALITGNITGAYNLSLSTLLGTQYDLVVSGAIQTSTGSVTVTSPVTATISTAEGVTLSGVNNYTGNTVIQSGILRVSSANNLGGANSSNSNFTQLSGGILDLRPAAVTNFVHPVLLTASSTIASDRSAAGAGLSLSLGVLNASGGTLTVTPGVNDTSGSGNLTFASTTVGPGASAFVATNGTGTGTPSTTLNLGVISRAAGSGTIDFPSTSTGTILVGNSPGFLGGWATYAATSFASVNSSGGVIAYTPTTQDNPASWTTGQDISDDSAGFTSGTVAPASINSLRFTGTGSTVNIGSGNTLTIASGGILINSTAGAQTINGGTLQGSAGGDLIVLQNSANVATINSVIANNTSPTALTKSGTGTLVLAGSNTYSGGTTIAAGTLQGNTGTLQGNILDNGTLTFAQITNGTFSGTITGIGSLIKTNAGTASSAGIVTITGTNSYSGGTNISSGTIKLGTSTALGTGAVTVSGQSGNTAWLDLNGMSPANNISISGDDYLWNSAATTAVLSGNITIASYARLGNANNTTAGTDNITFNGVVSGSSGINKGGVGLIILNGTNTYTSYTNITGGVLRGNLGVGIPTSTVLTLAGGTLETGTNFTDSLGITAGTVAFTAGADGLSAYGAPITVAIGGTASPTALVWGVTTNFSPTSLILNSTYANNTLTFQNPLDFNGSNQTITVGAATAIASGILSNANGTGGFIKQGSGTLVLTAANTYNGNTNISAGTLQMGNGGTTGIIPGAVINNAALTFNRSDSSLTFANNISGSGTVTQAGAGILVLSGTNSYAGQTSIASGEIQLGSSTALGNTTAPVVVSSGATLDENGYQQSLKPISIAGTGLTGLGALINSSTTGNAEVGAVTLTANATIGVANSAYAARMDIGGGTVAINGSTYTLTKAGAGNLRINGGTVALGGLNISAGELSVLANNNFLFSGLPVSVSAGADLFLYSSNDAANTTFATNAILEDNTGNNSLTGTTTLTGTGKTSFNFDQNLTLTASGLITGTGGISMNAIYGNKFLLTNTSNNYSGGTLINSGLLTAGASGSLSPNSAFQIYGGTLDTSAYTNSIASLIVNTGGVLQLGIGTPLTDLGTATFAGTLNLSTGTVGTLPETLMTYTSYTGAFNTSIGVPTGDKLAYTTHALEIVSAGPANLAWDNAGGTGNGTSWDTTSQNWNNGSAATTFSNTSNTSNGDNVTFNDFNNAHYNVIVTSAGVTPNTITVNTAATYNFSGGSIGGGGGLTLTAGTLNVANTTQNAWGSTTVNGGTLILANNTALPINQTLTIASGATVQVTSHSGGPSNVTVLQVGTLNNSGTIDLTNNSLAISSGSTVSSITTEVKAAYNGGSWTGTSSTGGVITSTTAAADTTYLTAVGVATGLTSFDGITVPSTDILVKYTYYGDTNLDGAVDGSDYTNIDNGFNNHLTGWQNGDFNYDSIVDGSDYTLIDNAYNMQGNSYGTNSAALIASATAQIAGPTSAVPEPTTLGLLGIGAVGLLARRRRCH